MFVAFLVIDADNIIYTKAENMAILLWASNIDNMFISYAWEEGYPI